LFGKAWRLTPTVLQSGNGSANNLLIERDQMKQESYKEKKTILTQNEIKERGQLLVRKLLELASKKLEMKEVLSRLSSEIKKLESQIVQNGAEYKMVLCYLEADKVTRIGTWKEKTTGDTVLLEDLRPEDLQMDIELL
jgi:N-acetylglucosamine-6-phosphate deacetylase